MAPERSKSLNIVEGKGMWKVEEVRDFIDSILPSSALLQLGPFLLFQTKLAWGRQEEGKGMVSGRYLIEAPCARSYPVCYHRGLEIHTTQVPEKRHAHKHRHTVSGQQADTECATWRCPYYFWVSLTFLCDVGQVLKPLWTFINS